MFPAERMMGLWQGVVAGFDGTPEARSAVRWAAAEAAARGCRCISCGWSSTRG